MMHAPIWWYAWLGVVLLCGAVSLLKRYGDRLATRPGRRVRGRLAASDVDWNSDLALSGEDGHAGGDQQVVAAAPDEADHMGRYAMALATHEPISSMAATGTPSSSSGSCVRG